MRPPLPRPRIHAAAATASLLLHALLLLAIGGWYGSTKPPPAFRAAGGSRVLMVDVLPSAAPSPSLPRRPESSTPSREDAPAPAPREVTVTDDTAAAAPGAGTPAPGAGELAPGGGTRLSAASALRAGFRDPRPWLEPAAPRPQPGRATPAESFRAALEADDEATARAERENLARRQITLFGRKVTVLGDSSKVNWRDLTVIFSGKRAVLPIDGREWQDLQMRKQNVDFVRDSILRERARATRERRR